MRGLIAYDQSLAPYLTSSKVLGVVEAVFGSNVRASMTTALVTKPGQERGGWHSDWPFGQMQARHLPAPYPDVTAHLTTIWMLTPFTLEGGGTLLVPGSHRASNNPSDDNMGVADMDAYPTEVQATGSAGSVLIFDSRLWHSTAANDSGETRVAVVVRWGAVVAERQPDHTWHGRVRDAGRGDREPPRRRGADQPGNPRSAA